MQSLPSSADAPGIPGEHHTFFKLLEYLNRSGSINQQQYEHLKLKVPLSGGLNLDRILGLFAEQDWMQKFRSSLPANSATSANLIAKNFEFSPPSPANLRLQDIKSISFEVWEPDAAPLKWEFSLHAYSPGRPTRTYTVALSSINVTIKWPASYGRTLQGTYNGTFKEEHRICGTFKPDFFRGATVYKTTLLGSFAMSKLLGIFGAEGFHYSDRLKAIGVQGPEVLKLNGFALDEPSLDTSFVVKTIRSKSFLTEVSGGFPSFKESFKEMDLGANWGNLRNESLFVDELRVVLSCINSSVDYQIVFELGGELDRSIPFRLSVGLWGSETSFEMTLFPGLLIGKLLELTGSSNILDVNSHALSNLSNELPISSAIVAWVGHELRFLGLGLGVEDWKIVEKKFEIKNLVLEIQSTNPYDADEFFLSGSGIVELGHVELEVSFMVQLLSASFRVASYGRPLSLNSLFIHLVGDRLTLPSGFTSLLDQPSIDSMIVEGSHGSDGWSLLLFAMTMGCKEKLNISDDFQLSLPSLAVDITDPFHKVTYLGMEVVSVLTRFAKTGRSIQARIDACATISADVNCAVSIDLNITPSQSVDDSITVKFHEDGVLTLKALLNMFGIQNTSSCIPTHMSFLLGIGLANASATLSHSGGKYSLSDMSVSVVSSRSLQLWHDVVLGNLSLDFNYSTSLGLGVNFSADLSFGGDSDMKVDLTYDDLPSPPSQPPSTTLGSDTISMTATSTASWSAKTKCDVAISVPDIISHISDIDIKGDLSSVASGLTLLPELNNFNFDRFANSIKLRHCPSRTSLTFTADTDFLIIPSLSLECWKAGSWLYSLNLNLCSTDFFSRLGINGLSLDDTAIIISNGHRVELSVALTLDSPLKDVGCIKLLGDFGENFFKLQIETPNLNLFGGMTLSGYMGIEYVNSDVLFFIEGEVKHIDISDLSSKTFGADFSLSVEIPDPEVVFTLQVSRLENAFECHGLNFEGILFGIGSQEFPFPSELAIAGQVQFCVGKDSFAGAMALYLDQDSLSNCGVKGSFHICPSFSQALTGFSPADTGLDNAGNAVPAHMDGAFTDLSFQISPQGFRVGGIEVPQGYGLAGSLNLPSCGFDASFDIEIDASSHSIHVDGQIKNALVFPKTGSRLFALSQASCPNKGPSMAMTITTTSFRCDLSAEVHLLGLSAGISVHISDNGLEIHEFIDAWVGGARLDLVVNKDVVSFSMYCTLTLSFPSFRIGLTDIPATNVVRFSALLSTRLDWSKDSWELAVTGDLSLMGWHLGTHTFTLGIDITALEKLACWIAHQIESLFMSAFATKILHMLDDSIREVVVVLKAIGMEAIHVGRLLVKHFGCVASEVVKEVGYVFTMAAKDLAPIMKDVEMAYHDAVHTLVQLGHDIESITDAVAETFECSVDEVGQEYLSAPVHFFEHFL